MKHSWWKCSLNLAIKFNMSWCFPLPSERGWHFMSARTSNSLQSLRCISILRSPSLIFMLFDRCATRLLWVPKLCMYINMLRFALAHLVPLLLQLVHSLFSGSLGRISCISLYLAWSSLMGWPSRPWSLITVMNLGHDLSSATAINPGQHIDVIWEP